MKKEINNLWCLLMLTTTIILTATTFTACSDDDGSGQPTTQTGIVGRYYIAAFNDVPTSVFCPWNFFDDGTGEFGVTWSYDNGRTISEFSEFVESDFVNGFAYTTTVWDWKLSGNRVVLSYYGKRRIWSDNT